MFNPVTQQQHIHCSFRNKTYGTTYSGFCPTSTIARIGTSPPANASLMYGNAARTSGHQDCLVVGSVEEMKAMNNFESGPPGSVNSFTELGSVGFLVIGIFAALINRSRSRCEVLRGLWGSYSRTRWGNCGFSLVIWLSGSRCSGLFSQVDFTAGLRRYCKWA